MSIAPTKLSQEVLNMTYDELNNHWLDLKCRHSYLDLIKGGNHIEPEFCEYENKLYQRVCYFNKLIQKANLSYGQYPGTMTIKQLKQLTS